MATYLKLNDCPQTFTISDYNDAINSSVLTVKKTTLNNISRYSYVLYSNLELVGTRKNVYIGFSDESGNFEGNNTATSITLESDTTGCSAIATKQIDVIDSSGYNTASLIHYTLNKCTASRVITFSYKSTPIFKISQTYNTSTTSYIYAFYINAFLANDYYNYAWFDNSSPSTISVSNNNTYRMFLYDLTTGESYIFFYYTLSKFTFATDKTVSEIIDLLTHVSGNDNLSNYGSYYYLTVPDIVNSYNNGTPTTVSVSENSTICLYRYSSNVFVKIATIMINADTKDYHLGKYKYTKIT